MRVAFTLIGGPGWTGGRNYLRNLLASLALLETRSVEPVLFVGASVTEEDLPDLLPHLASKPRFSPVWDRTRSHGFSRGIRSLVLQSDPSAERVFRQERIDLVFQHGTWYGLRFGFPTVAWIADFQHRRLPSMFRPGNWMRREAGYWGLSVSSTTVLLSSQDARSDCERFYPLSRGRTAVLPFAVAIPRESWSADLATCRARYDLPERYLYVPNQFWKHKNHLGLIQAVALVRERCPELTLVLSGAMADNRHPEHPKQVADSIERMGLGAACRILGSIPYPDVLTLIRGARALVNPSFSEGWSTTVEEAKVLQTSLVLSDLAVHREQAADRALFFDPNDPSDLARALEIAWGRSGSPDAGGGTPALAREAQLRFAEGFVRIANETVARFHGGLGERAPSIQRAHSS